MQVIKVGTRGSLLARTQTAQTVERLQQLADEAGMSVRFETVIIQTTGDRILDVALSKAGGKGLFTKEIEAALFDRSIDVAVHSMKDVPFQMDDAFVIAAVPRREDPRDAWLSVHYADWDALPDQAIVGTSSLRRAAAVRHARPDVQIALLRGNVDTRYQKMRNGEYDAILLAAAGLHRLGWRDRIRSYVPLERCIPAVGQGALALQARSNDDAILEILQLIHDPDTSLAVQAERMFMAELEGSCQVPLGANALFQNGIFRISGSLSVPDGKRVAVEYEQVLVQDYPNVKSFEQAAVATGKLLALRLKQMDHGNLWREVKASVQA
jgi:hydroxymethylbilane synthase